VPLLLLDLDNTLLDRAAAFRSWAGEILAQLGAPKEDVDWLIKVDDDGTAPRLAVAEEIRQRYGLSMPPEDIIDDMQRGAVANTRLDPLVACALHIAGNAGWVPVVVTNGMIRQQEAKIRMTGLDRYLADWVISEEAGVRKPDPHIFAIAADRARQPLRGAWMIGDTAEVDIAGAANAGIRSVWLHRGRMWREPRFQPTITADTAIAALAAVLDNY
jgi:putative hydrolase of the HAD superfamily